MEQDAAAAVIIHRLGGKPNFKGRGMSWTGPPVAGPGWASWRQATKKGNRALQGRNKQRREGEESRTGVFVFLGFGRLSLSRSPILCTPSSCSPISRFSAIPCLDSI
jgi:hypothetical protein